jgi:hypothetical protein
VKKPFHETTWSEVEVGDIALVAWPTGKKIDVVKVEITIRAADPAPGDEQLVAVFFRRDGLIYGQTFSPDDPAYVQSRL